MKNIFLDIVRSNMKNYCDKHLGGCSDEINKKYFYDCVKIGKVFSLKYKIVPIGYQTLKVIYNCPYLIDLQIKKDFQTKGFGSKTLNYVQNIAERLNCNSILLTVFNDNPAIELYKRLGFKINYSKHDGKAVQMIKTLK
jgi:ribosomal protein S18 acetylase RimI-like enzyme